MILYQENSIAVPNNEVHVYYCYISIPNINANLKKNTELSNSKIEQNVLKELSLRIKKNNLS